MVVLSPGEWRRLSPDPLPYFPPPVPAGNWRRTRLATPAFAAGEAILPSWLTPAGGPAHSTLLEQIAQLHARLVELRFAVADGAAHHLRNLVMLVALNVMQHKDDAVSRGQAFHGALQVYAINRARQHIVAFTDVFPGTIFLLRLHRFLQRNLRQPFLPQVHEHHIHGEPVQPGRECRLTAKGGNLAVELKKCLLGQVL